MFTGDDIVRATAGTPPKTEIPPVSGVGTDSRRIGADELFVPLRGERFDGHDYIGAALDRGVRVVLAERSWLADHAVPAGCCCIAVDDTRRALGDLAMWHRRRFPLPVVGITGSNGKTTTKEMLAAIMATTGEGLKTSGNLNNLIGLPQMLFQLDGRHAWAVLEMGMSEPGEIDRLAEIARPQVGVITNAYAAHLESMGSVAAVARAKGELFLRLPPGGWAIANADDPLVSVLPAASGVHRLGFGLEKGEVRARNIRADGLAGQSFQLSLPEKEIKVRLRAYGSHAIANALAAAAAATVLGVSAEAIRDGLEGFAPVAKRFAPEELAGFVLIDDSYNANPASMAAALITLRSLGEECRKIAVLGDMLELGEGSGAAHRELGRLAGACVDRLYLLGEMALRVAEGAIEGGLALSDVIVASSHGEMIAELGRILEQGDYVLVKGSRGMRMDTVAEGLRQHFAARREP